MDDIVLSIKGITKRYPGVTALDDVSLEFHKGEVHALVGENGAGKSTLIKVISGAVTPDSGEIIVGTKGYTSLTPHQAKEEHIEVIYQEFNLVDSLSVAENISFGERSGTFVNFSQMENKALEVLGMMGITQISPKTQVGKLPSSQKQLIEIAKSVSRDAKILIMDEPSAPLSVAEVDKMFEIVRMLKNKGVTIIYISHRLDEIFSIADRVTVMRDGKYIATKLISETGTQELIALMVGRELKESYPVRNCEPGTEALKVEELCGNGDSGISFTLHRGEILGIAGLVGAGRTELARLLFGADKLDSGSIFVNNRKVELHLPGDALCCGIGLIPEDRKQQGCFLEKAIDWNCVISCLKSISRGLFVDEEQQKILSDSYREKLEIKTPTMRQLVKNLSGGNQQKVVIAKTLAANSDILIFDEPTRGIDVGAKQEIYKLMCEMVENGKAILMITSDMQELLGMSDRIIVLYKGQISGELRKEEFSQEKVLEYASGIQ